MKFPEWLKVYGDTSYRGNCPTETAEQITFFSQLRSKHPHIGCIALHIRNEGKRSVQQVQRQKAEGMVSGASDIVIPGSPAFVCELKRKDHTKCKWQPNQIEYLEAAKTNGAFVCVALTWKDAMKAVEEWINVTNQTS